jgi:hypothetical protein
METESQVEAASVRYSTTVTRRRSHSTTFGKRPASGPPSEGAIEPLVRILPILVPEDILLFSSPESGLLVGFWRLAFSGVRESRKAGICLSLIERLLMVYMRTPRSACFSHSHQDSISLSITLGFLERKSRVLSNHSEGIITITRSNRKEAEWEFCICSKKLRLVYYSLDS